MLFSTFICNKINLNPMLLEQGSQVQILPPRHIIKKASFVEAFLFCILQHAIFINNIKFIFIFISR